jgi:hypothetical protein
MVMYWKGYRSEEEDRGREFGLVRLCVEILNGKLLVPNSSATFLTMTVSAISNL